MNTSQPIGLFDSGVGGLTVLAAMHRAMPGEDYAYLGDTARLPYGTKSPETIIRYALQASKKLIDMGVKVLVVACNTASAVALPSLRQAYPSTPVIGVIEAGAKAACSASAHGRIAVIATESTVRGRAYEQAILRLRPTAHVQSLACPLFVPLAEEAWFEGPLVEGIVAQYLNPLFLNGADTQRPDCLVLGCTHYPLLTKAIANVVGEGVTLVDSAATTAVAVNSHLANMQGYHPQGKNRQGQMLFFTTDDAPRFMRTGSFFLGRAIDEENVNLVDL